MRPRKWHSRPEGRIGGHKSGYGKNANERVALTIWRPHHKGLVRTRKEYDRASGTHVLETAWGGTSQDMGRTR